MARPIEWTDDLKEAAISIIIERITKGESIRRILNKDRKNLPSNFLFLKWVSEDEALAKQYAQAMNVRADLMFDEMLDIADSTGDDIIELDDGRQVVNHEVINRDRLRVDTRKWVLSRMNPKKYGEKVDVTSGGEKIEPVAISFTEFNNNNTEQ